ncbi:MAG: IclR family transcriptional regulator [Bryobacteraceae bacterium]
MMPAIEVSNSPAKRLAPAQAEVRSISKALDLLCCFSPGHPEWGVTEIAEYLGLCKSAAHRILTTCERYGFVDRTSERRYRLGTRVLELGNVCRWDRRLLVQAEPVLRNLSERTQSIAHLGVLDGREVLELQRSSGPKSILFTESPRFRMSLHCTGLGKVLLAYGGPRLFDRLIGQCSVLKPFTPYTISAPSELKIEVEKIARQGYAIADQESVIGCRCIAVPIRNRAGTVVAAVSISNKIEKFDYPLIPHLLADLYEAAGAIQREL